MFQITLITLVLALSWSYAVDGDGWAVYKKKFNKTYTNEEDLRRRAIWQDNMIKMIKHNELYAQGKTSFNLKENMFSDMVFENSENLSDDIVSIDDIEVPVSAKLVTKTDDFPDIIDWRQKNGVTEVKNQGSSPTCWAFATVAAVESHHLISTGNYVLLSESNLVDCADFEACTSLADPFQYIIDKNGIATAASYPFNMTKGRCKFSSSVVGAQIKSYVQLERGSEAALKEAIAKKGPVTVGIDASLSTFRHYSTGVYEDPNCSKTRGNHAVLVVGYGTSSDGQEYWILKNSWGAHNWGENGYMRIARNNNMCGIANTPIYPVVGGISGQESLTNAYMFLYALILQKLYF